VQLTACRAYHVCCSRLAKNSTKGTLLQFEDKDHCQLVDTASVIPWDMLQKSFQSMDVGDSGGAVRTGADSKGVL
jgi:hypothetical protein